jgi:3-(3-hydroxy-phenyl)propionate hydroxylase
VTYIDRAPVLADLKKLGILEEVQKISFADERAIWQWRRLNGDLLAEMHWSLLEDAPDERLVKPYTLQCGQHLLAKVLTEYCGRFSTTNVLFDHTLVELEQNADSKKVVAKVAKRGDTDSVLTFTADWVLGADGGKSSTRKLIGESLEGFTWATESFVAMNVYFPFAKYGWGTANFLIGGEEWAVAGRAGPLNDPWRVAFGVEPGLTDEYVKNEIAPKRLEKILPGDDPYEIVQCSQYRVHQRQASRYKVGRVVLVGDAAHLNNPIGGFGLTTGMTDAGCISDALAMVIKGEAGEELLQKACDKRHEIFKTISNPGSQKFKAMVQQDPNNISSQDREFFEKLNTDTGFHRNALLGSMQLYTPVESLV